MTGRDGKSTVAPLSQPNRRRIVWSIAGFDPSSGAGVTADLVTFAAYGLFGCSAITALTVQSTLGVFGSEPVRAEHLRATLEALYADLPAEGIKIGMLGNAEIALEAAAFLERNSNRAGGTKPWVVLDPVLRSSSGSTLFPESGLIALHDRLLPQVDWITPNWAELAVLAEVPVTTMETAMEAGKILLQRHPHLSVVVTGGDQQEPEDVLLRAAMEPVGFSGEKVETTSTHGTGCAFSSALLAELLLGAQPGEAVRRAKRFVERALRAAPGLGGGRGPMDLLWPLRGNGDALPSKL